MAQSTSYGVALAGSVQGAPFDISSMLTRVAPEDTPLFSLLPHSEAPKATTTEWLADTLDTPQFGSPLVDGTDIDLSDTTDEIVNRVRLSNKVEQFQRQTAISPIAEMVEMRGPGSSLMAQAQARILVQLKCDIEAGIASAGVQADGSSSSGSKMSGLFHITDPTATTGFFDTAGKRNFRSVSGSRHSSGNLNESNFRAVVQNIYEAGGKSQTYRLFAGPTLMNALTDFSRALNVVGGNQARFNANIEGKALTLSVVEIVSDYGIIQVIPNLFLNRTSGQAPTALSKKSGLFIPEGDDVSLKFLQPITNQALPDVGGGGERALTRAILTVCAKNPRSLGSITTTS
ncbi:major head protein [uncultured Mediterranean phage uvMED]|nr:major head protein [uncultured Mediterranean phage uvMED]